jgi:hypothetical protein
MAGTGNARSSSEPVADAQFSRHPTDHGPAAIDPLRTLRVAPIADRRDVPQFICHSRRKPPSSFFKRALVCGRRETGTDGIISDECRVVGRCPSRQIGTKSVTESKGLRLNVPYPIGIAVPPKGRTFVIRHDFDQHGITLTPPTSAFHP